jgi:hypothetical protein
MSPGKFMVINGVACLGVVALIVESGSRSGFLVIGLIAYFWVSLGFYRRWYMDSAPLRSMSAGELYDLEQEWIGHGPFGRNKANLSRLRAGNDAVRYDRALDRMAAIYQERIRRDPKDHERVKEWTRLRESMLAKKSRPNPLTKPAPR